MNLIVDMGPSASGNRAAKELMIKLVTLGLPQDSIEIRANSSESMDVGSILSINVHTLIDVLVAAGHISLFSHCVYETVSKYRNRADLQHGTISKQLEFRDDGNALREIDKLIQGIIDDRAK